MAVYETAGKESVFGTKLASGGPAKTLGNQYDNLSFVEAATYWTLDTGVGKVTAAFDWIGGALNGQLAMRPVGGAPESAIVTGLLYKNGPITLGAETAWVWSQGAQQLTTSHSGVSGKSRSAATTTWRRACTWLASISMRSAIRVASTSRRARLARRASRGTRGRRAFCSRQSSTGKRCCSVMSGNGGALPAVFV